MTDFTSWYFVLKQFKLQQFNIKNQQFTNNTLHEGKCSTELLVFLKLLLKTLLISLENV